MLIKVPTPHIEARKGEIAETIRLPKDPFRAKMIAGNFLTSDGSGFVPAPWPDRAAGGYNG